MHKVINEYYCDICKSKVDYDKMTQLNLPIFKHYEDTEGRITNAYLSVEKGMQLCPTCLQQVIKVHSYYPDDYRIENNNS